MELAERFNGEVINGDAMQLYKGLPIITNKITTEEMRGVPHHLLGKIGLDEDTWTVGKFVANALVVVSLLHCGRSLSLIGVRLTKSEVVESCLSLLAEHITTRSHCSSRTPYPRNHH